MLQASRRLKIYRSVRYSRLLRPAIDSFAAGSYRTIASCLPKPNSGQLVLVGHMRSGSSLLSALLTSNPEIAGYGEAKVVYRKPSDFSVLRGKTTLARLLNRKKPDRDVSYVFDKVLHDWLMPSPEILTSRRTKVLILLRQPEQTVRSLIKQFGWTTKQSRLYLLRQYKHIRRVAHQDFDDKPMIVHHSDILKRSTSLLGTLSAWLDLDQKLELEYSTDQRVRIVGSSDTSDRFKSGRIVNERREHEVNIDLDQAEELNQNYEELHKSIADYVVDWADLQSESGPGPRSFGSSRSPD